MKRVLLILGVLIGGCYVEPAPPPVQYVPPPPPVVAPPPPVYVEPPPPAVEVQPPPPADTEPPPVPMEALSPDEVAAITRCISGWLPMGDPNQAVPESRCIPAAREIAPTWGERERARLDIRRASED